MYKELEFNKITTKKGCYWEAECKVEADFAVHVERKELGRVHVDLTSIEGKQFAMAHVEQALEVFDKDFDAIVYPKWIRVRTWSEPTYGAVAEREE